MLLYEFPSSIKSNMPFNLTIENNKDQIHFNINKYNVEGNSLNFKDNSILFTTPEKELKLFEQLKPMEMEYLISKMCKILADINLPETISLFHYDQIFNNNMFKLYKSQIKLTHIISSNYNIKPIYEKDEIIINDPHINIDVVNQKLYSRIVKDEIDNSLIFIKINNPVNIQMIFKVLYNFSNILYYDNYNKIISIKLKYPMNLIEIFSTIVPKVMVQDRTTELHSYLK